MDVDAVIPGAVLVDGVTLRAVARELVAARTDEPEPDDTGVGVLRFDVADDRAGKIGGDRQ